MGQVHWAESALDDLSDIVDFIAKDSPAYADRLAAKLVEAPRRLAQFPRIGSMVPEFQQDSIRELWVRPYRIIYVVRGESCCVAAIVHGSRDLSSLLPQDDLPGE
jgi:addiction module RelE/StbE family toxin